MPIRIEYQKEGEGVVLHHEGVVTGEELIDAISRVYEDVRFPTLKFWIGDRTSCTKFLPDTNCMRTITKMNQKHAHRNPGMLLALVAPKDFEFGMSRMFQAYSESGFKKTLIFRDIDSADEWIRYKLASSEESLE